MPIETALSYPGISAQGFAHPADRAAAAALHSVPMLDRVIKKLTEASYERLARQLMLGNSVRLGEDQLPEVWAMQRRFANTFDITPCPALYVTQFPVGNGLDDRRQRARDAHLVRSREVVRLRRAPSRARPRDGARARRARQPAHHAGSCRDGARAARWPRRRSPAFRCGRSTTRCSSGRERPS